MIAVPWGPAIASQCDPQDAQGRKVLTVEARTISVGRPQREYPLKEEVQVNIVNKNPFRFEYTLAVEESIVEEPAIDTFLGLPYFGSLAALVTGDAQDPAVPAAAARPIDASSCSTAWQDRNRQLDVAVSEYVDDVDTAKSSVNSLSARINPLKSKLTQAKSNLNRPDASCSDLLGYIQTLQTDFATTPQLKSALTRLESELTDANLAHSAVQKQIKDITTALAADAGAGNACRQAITQSLASAETRGEAYRLLYTDLVSKQKSHTSTVAAMEAGVADATQASSRADSFTSSAVLGPYGAATDVTVTLKRKDTTQQSASDEQVASLIANFGGGPKFSLSIGLGFGGLKTREFRREQSVDPSSGSVVNVVGLSEDSDWRLVPMVFLHGKVLDDWSVTAGLGPHSDDQGTQVDAFLGASWHFASRGRLSLGGYLGKEQQLGGSFEVGDVVPEDVAEIPVKRSSEVGIGVFLSWVFGD